MRKPLLPFLLLLFVGNLKAQTSVTIPPCITQVWMQKNLDVTTYRDGTPIPMVTDATVWANLTTGAYCYYSNNAENGTVYGILYNWYAVTDPRGLAPIGWHIPSDAEWATLVNNLGGDAVAGGALKETASTHWTGVNTGANNYSGFTGLPGGARMADGTFFFLGNTGLFWSSTSSNIATAFYLGLYTQNTTTMRTPNSKRSGYSVRCIKDL